jgi:hypothetical protein
MSASFDAAVIGGGEAAKGALKEKKNEEKGE